MSKLSPARKLALDVLMEADRRGMYARDVLSSRASAKAIDQRDSAFAARLALGVAATQGILDELLDQFLDKPKKVAPRVRMALRISAFEMLYLHTPGRVAVSQGVELVRSGAKSAAGLANAVLHKVADNVEDFATASDVDESERRLVRLSRLMGLPRWLCARIMASFDTPEGEGFTVAPLSEAQILQLSEYDHAKSLVTLRQNDRGLFQSVPVNSDSYDGHFCARLVRQ